MTGLSGAGKTTLAYELEQKILLKGINVMVLDGDILRNGINSNLGFSEEDRFENIRRAAEIAKLFLQKNFICICSFITPLESMRQLAKNIVGSKNYIEVFIDCSLDTCEKRDVKGLYKKVRLNQIDNFTGISSNFENPVNPNFVINTEKNGIKESVDLLLKQLELIKENKYKLF